MSTRPRPLACAVLLLAALAATASGCGSKQVASTVTVTTAAAPTTTTALSFADLVANVRSGVVRIETDDCSGGAIGTGFLLSPRLVATVEHVVDGSTSIHLKQNGKVVASGTVIGSDTTRDLALVRADTPLTGHVFTMATRAPQLGEDVAALGFPLGLPLTVTRGSVSGSDRTVPIDGVQRHSLVQTDAAVNPGNSGGPLVADDGSVVGLVDLGTDQANGLAFAVSSLVAGPLLSAWRVAPQPIANSQCGGSGSSTQVATPAPTTTAPDIATAARDAVYTYWSFLQLNEYRQAFELLTASEQNSLGGIGKWLSYYAGDPVESVDVTLEPATVSGSTAYVSIAALETVGASTGCKQWTGSYRLVLTGAGWRIDYAKLSPTSC